MHAAIDAYITCALWSSTDEDGEPLDSYEVSDATYTCMSNELQAFVETCEEHALDALEWYKENFDASQFAHDFWLTRNRHGAGYWDRDYTEPGRTHLRALTKLAHAEGEQYLYLDPDTMRVMID